MCFASYLAREGGGVVIEGHDVFVGPARVAPRLDLFETARVLVDTAPAAAYGWINPARVPGDAVPAVEYGWISSLSSLLTCFADVLGDLMPEPAVPEPGRRQLLPALDLALWRDVLDEAEQAIAPDVTSSLPIFARTFDGHSMAVPPPSVRTVWNTLTAAIFPGASIIVVDAATIAAGIRTGIRHRNGGREHDIKPIRETAMPVAGFDNAMQRAIARRVRLAPAAVHVDYMPNDFALGESIASSSRSFYALRATRGGRFVWLTRIVPPFVIETACKRLYQFPSSMIGVVFDPLTPPSAPDPVCLTPEFRHPFINYAPGVAGGRAICVQGLSDQVRREDELIAPRRMILALDIAAAGLHAAAHDRHGYSRIDELEPLRSTDARDPNAVFVPWTPNFEDVDDAYDDDIPW